jgi:vitamin B12 transporter
MTKIFHVMFGVIFISLNGGATSLAQSTQTGSSEVDELVVTATGMPQPLGEVGSSVSLITAEEIKRNQDRFVDTALSRLSGITFDQEGGAGGVGYLRIRGFDRQYATILLDGINIGDPADPQGAAELAHLLTADIERIEVLRGSQSVLYGSNAVAGTVNIITKNGQGPIGGRVDMEAGSYKTRQAVASIRGGDAKRSGRLTIGSLDREPDSEFRAFPEREDYENRFLLGRLDLALSDDVDLTVTGRAVDASADHDGFDPMTYLPRDGWFGTDTQEASGHVTLNKRFLDDRAALSFNAGRSEKRRDSFAEVGPYYWYDGQRDTYALRGHLQISPIVAIFAGYDAEEESFSQIGFAEKQVDHAAGYVMGQLDLPAETFLSLGLRRDDHDLFGTHDTWRLAVATHPVSGLTLRAAHGTGFRAPSLYELYGEDPFCLNGLCGNAALQPEESKSTDLGFELQSGASSVQVTLFRIAIENRIVYDGPPPSYLGNYKNMPGTSESDGIEIGASTTIGALQLSGNMTYLDPREADGAVRNKQARQLLNLNADYDFADGRGSLGATWRQVGHRYIYNLRQEDYGLAAVRATWRLTDALEISGRVENLFDDVYETSAGKSTAGRGLYVGVSRRF